MRTEQASARFLAAEDWSVAELTESLIESQWTAVAGVHAARHQLAEAVARTAERLNRGGRLIYLGAGTSGRIALQDAAELTPTFDWPAERALVLMAGGSSALAHAIEGAEDDRTEAPRWLAEIGVCVGDVVIGLAASGRTPFTLAGIEAARRAGALTIGIHNDPGSPMETAAELPVALDTGAEFPAGSTRMKAGTAQKIALNCWSTGVMTRLGRVYRGQMVDMRATNEKLGRRAARIVAELTGADEATAKHALAQTDQDMKPAVVMIARQLDAPAARALLDRVNGRLREALMATTD